MRVFPIEEAIKAQKALRDAAGLEPEMFPVEAFVGMISDEIDQLRSRGKSDGEIANLVAQHSNIEISAGDIAAHYAPPEARGHAH